MRHVGTVALVALTLGVGCGGEMVSERSSVAAEMERRVRQQLHRRGRARVLVNLAVGRGQSISSSQQRVLSALGHDFRSTFLYQHAPAVAGVLREGGIERLLALPGVASVQIDEPGRGHLAQAVPALQANAVHTSYGWTGKGVRVAVLDSGIDTDHPDLMDDLVAQQCFNSCPPGGTVQGPSAEDDHGHGTATSGIITSKGTISAVGFAPDAEIVAVKVLDGSITGSPSQWVAGLDWVLTNLSTLKVDIVNMSLGTWSTYSGNCDAQQPALAAVIQKLVAQGVTIFASSGNTGVSSSIDAPACITGVIAVGATYDSDMGRQPPTGTYPTGCFDATSGLDVIACFTSSGSELDLVAPGVKITSTYLGGGTITWSGTSLASPAAAAVAALLLECDPGFTPSALETALEQSGPMIIDPKNGLGFPRVHALTAINQSCACVGKPDGAACHDGQLCTVDLCKAGVCSSTAMVCTALDQCHVAGTCNPATGICSDPIKPVATSCDDADPCTKQDACNASGACGGAAYACAASQCEAASTCDGLGGCIPTYAAAGAACDDGQICTKGDACDGNGGCAGTSYTCTPSQCEAASSCDGQGGCTPTPRADGTACDDGDACTQTDSCQAGLCSGADPVTCPAPVECHEPGTCDPQTGVCSDPLSPDGTACSGGGTCAAGACVPAPDLGAIPDSSALDAGAPAIEAGNGPDLFPPDAAASPRPDGCSCELGASGEPASGPALVVIVLLALCVRWRLQHWRPRVGQLEVQKMRSKIVGESGTILHRCGQ